MITPLTASTIDFEIDALYSRMQVLSERKKYLKEQTTQNDLLFKETEKQFNEKVKEKMRLDKIGNDKRRR